MDTNRKDDYNTEAEPLLDLYDIHHASSSSSHDQQQTLPPGYYVDMTDIDSTTKNAHHSTSPAAVVAPAHANNSAPASSGIQAEYPCLRDLGNWLMSDSAALSKEALAGSKSTIMYKNMSPRLAFGHKTVTGGGSFQQGKIDIGVNAGRVTLKLIKR
ncbi:hypothetical protein K457DRAFT_13780 [Linnemannia elongata AG-77]|uniref:Uncharacterized protein n=1 Tax=Linnemannia elongata AG-77 TaxID=1314771 RepID=A0A197KFR6_9FUNG|nr:hypothetical protein K457DRAFT_13780 [Linnemannia elongata AG-77]